jgi:pimeloyl-ACP methyl ester carboxylesterase
LLDVAGHRACVREAGSGPDVLLLPSMLVRIQSYGLLIELLARRFRVVAVEMPGCGRASRLERPWSFDDYARWLPAFLDRMGLERLPVIGHSNSGAVALLFAALHPKRVSHLVLADTVGADVSGSLWRVLVGRAVDALIEYSLSLRAWHHPASILLRHTRNCLRQVMLATRPYDVLAPRVAAPTLLAWGRRDHTMPLRCALRLRELIPDAELYVSAGGSHDWLITHASEFAAAFADFLARRSSEASATFRAWYRGEESAPKESRDAIARRGC